MGRLEQTLQALAARKQRALIPYFTAGYPNPAAFLKIVKAAAEAGAHAIELGMPFSDPIADGPAIQASSQAALAQGASLRRLFGWAGTLSKPPAMPPLILMTYYNPLLAFGLSKAAAEARRAGVAGLIIPDLPLEEAGEMEAACRHNELDLVYLAAPSTSAERLEAIGRRTHGFLYLVSLMGVTGTRDRLAKELPAFVRQAKAATRKPVCVGFGITTPEQAKAVSRWADGIVIGSALVELIQTAGPAKAPQAVGTFLTRMRLAINGSAKGRR